ncbi:hypothetical protein VTK56DRAFT_7992 [Thermocarpiscus australiensis]
MPGIWASHYGNKATAHRNDNRNVLLDVERPRPRSGARHIDWIDETSALTIPGKARFRLIGAGRRRQPPYTVRILMLATVHRPLDTPSKPIAQGSYRTYLRGTTRDDRRRSRLVLRGHLWPRDVLEGLQRAVTARCRAVPLKLPVRRSNGQAEDKDCCLTDGEREDSQR